MNFGAFRTDLSTTEKSGSRNIRRPLLTKSAGKIARFFRLSMNLELLTMLDKMWVNLLSRFMAISSVFLFRLKRKKNQYFRLEDFFFVRHENIFGKF